MAKVDGQPIHLSDLQDAAQALPQNVRGMPPQTLYPMLLDQLIDGRALVSEAHKSGLDKDTGGAAPGRRRGGSGAADRHAEQGRSDPASPTRRCTPATTRRSPASQARRRCTRKHILVDNEAEAKKIIAELKGGADFAALAKQYSKDPSGAQQGGDLGFFKKDEMVPEFAAAAFALQPGQVSQTPVHSQFGWHVIMVVERRRGEPPSFDQARDELRQKMIQEGVQKVVAKARASVAVEKFNLDGSPARATDQAEPPPAR